MRLYDYLAESQVYIVVSKILARDGKPWRNMNANNDNQVVYLEVYLRGVLRRSVAVSYMFTITTSEFQIVSPDHNSGSALILTSPVTSFF